MGQLNRLLEFQIQMLV